MAEYWSQRKRDTNRLVRAIATWLFAQKHVGPDQLLGLAKLTWITASHVNESTYIKSVKIPALGLIFARDYSKNTLSEVARDVSKQIGSARVQTLVLSETGFTNIYNAYRNSSADWMRAHFRKVMPIMRAAYHLNSDAQGRSLTERIDRLPRIKKSNQRTDAMHPANLLTPVIFALDKRIRFPILNGKKNVHQILARQGVKKGTLAQKFGAMISLYGKGGIQDAADLDEVGNELEDFLSYDNKSPKKMLLKKKSKSLPIKDENDLEVVQEERTAVRRNRHNVMTNLIRDLWAKHTLTEGTDTSAKYDVMVENYAKSGHDLIVEVKSSAETANLRMAVGQLYSYAHHLDEKKDFHLCVLLPERPSDDDARWLEWLDIGLIWFSGKKLQTNCDWLALLT